LYDATFRAGLSVAYDERPTREIASHIDYRVREGCQIRKRFLEVSPSRKIPPRNAHHFSTAPFAKVHEEQRFRNGRISSRPWSAGGEIRRRQFAL